jgi:hypothetical protein
MIFFEPGLYLRVEEIPKGPLPLPMSSGFSLGNAYRAIGLYNPSETSDAYFILSNDRDELWFICNRHLRTYALMPETKDLRITITEWIWQKKEPACSIRL